MKETSSTLRPSIAALEAFLAVAQTGSFRRAAISRGIGASALSHVIRGLEESLGVRLFNRTSRSVNMTEAGRHLLASAGPALRDVVAALEGVGQFSERPSGLLRLNVPRITTALIIEPLAARFLSAYPEIRLEIASSDGLVDIVAQGFDAGIRRDRRLAPGMVAMPIGAAQRFAVVGSPSYLKTCSPPAHPQALRWHRCIERRLPSGTRYAWEFSRDGEAFEIEVSGSLVVDDTALMLRAAIDGVGLAFMFESLVIEHLASGALVRILEEWCQTRAQFFLFYPGHRQVPRPLGAFIEMAGGFSG